MLLAIEIKQFSEIKNSALATLAYILLIPTFV